MKVSGVHCFGGLREDSNLFIIHADGESGADLGTIISRLTRDDAELSWASVVEYAKAAYGDDIVEIQAV